MLKIRALRNLTLLRPSFKCFVSNISEKKFKYSFQVGSVRKIHPMRQLSDGTDRMLITPNLIAVTDHGSGTIGKQFSENLDGTYAEKLLKVLNSFFYNQADKYLQNPYELVESALKAIKLEGNCTLTLAMAHPLTGEVVFYYIGDSIYGIFQEKQVVMVEAVYKGLNDAQRLGLNSPSSGFVERYSYKDIKNEPILMASNGLWDNVGLDWLHYEVRGPNSFESYGEGEERRRGEAKSLQAIAERVGNIAAFYSRKGQYESPIFKRAKREGFEFPKEGYLDDIAVILAKVRREVEIM